MKKADFLELMRSSQKPLKAMVEMVPEARLDWAPAEGFMDMGQLLKHLSESWCILKMMVSGQWPFSGPDEMVDALKLENLPRCGKREAIAAMEKDISEAISFLESDVSEDAFFTQEVTAPWGFRGAIASAVLMARDHQIHHKMQLHIYLKLLGQPVNTQTLYGM